MRALALPIFAMAAVPGMPLAAEQSCDRYAALRRLPGSFEEIASADLVKAELFVLTDGTCTCENMPAVNRKLGKPAPDGINWSCREATSEERDTVR